MNDLYDANEDGIMADEIPSTMPARRIQEPSATRNSHCDTKLSSKRAFSPTMARTHNPVGRPRKWKDNAEKCKAYRRQKSLEAKLANNEQDDKYQLL